jgi:hypothetical protein
MIKIIDKNIPNLDNIFSFITVNINTLLSTGKGEAQFLEPTNRR